MTQPTLDFTKREATKRSLKDLEGHILATLEVFPRMRELENSNDLIRWIWKVYGDNIKAESILRLARKVRAEHPELDTQSNQDERANAEVAYREYNQI